MALPILPRAQAPIAGPMPTTIEWYNFFRSLLSFVTDNEGDIGQIADIISRLEALEEDDEAVAIIQGLASVSVFGSLAGGVVQVQLLNDTVIPGNTYYYGTGPDGIKGWFTVASALTASMDGIELVTGANGVTDIRPDDDLEAVEGIGTTGLATRTAANAWTTRTATGTANRITVTAGDGVSGNPTFDIAATYVGQASITTLGTVTTGTWQATAVAPTFGGTGQTAYALGDILYSGATNSLSRLPGNITTTKQYLSQTGTGTVSAAPAWATITGGDITGAALTKTDDTNVTLTLGGSPSTALLRSASLTLGWAGSLAATRGGTGQAAYTIGDILYSDASNSLAKLPGNTTTAKQFLSQTGTGSASAAPSWASLTGTDVAGAALTKTDDTNVTLTLGGSPSTALLRASSLTLGWTGTLAVPRGGTGLSAVAQGDLLYGSASNTLAALPKNTTATRYLSNTGTSNNPAWAQINLADGVTGDLPFANLTQGSALSVLGVTGNATADVASIAAGTDNQVLRRSGTALTFGAVNLASSNAVTGALPAANIAIAGYIDGLIMRRVSGTALTVTSGSAYIQSTGAILASTSDIAKSSLSLSASTWYHVYLYSNAGTPDVEIVTTAPVLYNGSARSKTGDTSRRYVGSVRTDSSGNIIGFSHHAVAGMVYYDLNTGFVVANGTASTSTAVSCANQAPITSKSVNVTIGNDDNTVLLRVSSGSGGAASSTTFLITIPGRQNIAAWISVDSSQQIYYAFDSAPSAGTYIGVIGYQFER